MPRPHQRALEAAEPSVFWLDRPDAPEPCAELEDSVEADLLVVGGGLTGLWAALLAKEQDPEQEVVLLEGERVAHGASGRNGGFMDASLTHGIGNGIARWPHEMETLERLARQNLDAILATIERHRIDVSLESSGALTVATALHQLDWLTEEVASARRFGWRVDLLDREQLRAQLQSPTYLGAAWHRDTVALVDPARLTWGLRDAALSAGVRVHEQSPVRRLVRDGAGVLARLPQGEVRARGALLATSAFPPLVRSIRRFVVPVYDYVLVTEPLSSAQLDSIGWSNRQGVTDSGNQFHYYRLTADNRILWGGYDAVYHFGNAMHHGLEQRTPTFERLAAHFFSTFPQLSEIVFTHRWGGAIDTCSRFSALFGAALSGRAVYVVGFTGLGVGASRFGASVALDLLGGRNTELTRLEMVRRRPVPFPPEPLRWLGITLTRHELARADRNEGRRGRWLRLLDRLGLGYDS